MSDSVLPFDPWLDSDRLINSLGWNIEATTGRRWHSAGSNYSISVPPYRAFALKLNVLFDRMIADAADYICPYYFDQPF